MSRKGNRLDDAPVGVFASLEAELCPHPAKAVLLKIEIFRDWTHL